MASFAGEETVTRRRSKRFFGMLVMIYCFILVLDIKVDSIYEDTLNFTLIIFAYFGFYVLLESKVA